MKPDDLRRLNVVQMSRYHSNQNTYVFECGYVLSVDAIADDPHSDGEMTIRIKTGQFVAQADATCQHAFYLFHCVHFYFSTVKFSFNSFF